MAYIILCSWLSISVETNKPLSLLSTEEQKLLLFDTITSILKSINKEKNTLLILEDIHWADPTTIEFLNYFEENLKSIPFLLLITSRNEIKDSFKFKSEIIFLKALKANKTEKIITAILKGKKINSYAMLYIKERTDGIPLFIEELTNMLLEQKYLLLKNDTYNLIESIEEQKIPVTLKDLLNTKLDQLKQAKETAQLAASIGREFNYSLLIKASLNEESHVIQHLKQLVDYNIIIRKRHVEGDIYTFRHALIRDASYESMTIEYRKKTHYKIAKTLENSFEQRVKMNPFEIATHFFKAEKYNNSITYGILSANKSLEKSASIEAITNAEQVLKWIPLIKDKQNQISSSVELYGILSSAHMQNSGWAAPQVLKYSESAINLLTDSHKYNDLVLHLWWKVLNGVVAGINDELNLVYKELGNCFTKVNAVNKSVILCGQAFIIYALGKENSLPITVQMCNNAIINFNLATAEESTGHENIYGFSVPVFAGCLLAVALNAMEQIKKAEKQVLNTLNEAKALNHGPSIGIALMYCAELYKLHNNREKVFTYSNELVMLSKENQLPIYEAYGQSQLDWSTDRLTSEQSTYNTLFSEQSMFSLAHYQSQYAEVYAKQKDYKSALKKINSCIKIDEKISHHYYLSRMYFLKATYLNANKANIKTVLKNANKGLAIAKKQGAQYYITEINIFFKTLNTNNQ